MSHSCSRMCKKSVYKVISGVRILCLQCTCISVNPLNCGSCSFQFSLHVLTGTQAVKKGIWLKTMQVLSFQSAEWGEDDQQVRQELNVSWFMGQWGLPSASPQPVGLLCCCPPYSLCQHRPNISY